MKYVDGQLVELTVQEENEIRTTQQQRAVKARADVINSRRSQRIGNINDLLRLLYEDIEAGVFDSGIMGGSARDNSRFFQQYDAAVNVNEREV